MSDLNGGSVYIIAEAGVNHNGRKDHAFSLIDIAADAGADAVKFQTFSAKKLASRSAPKATYQKAQTDHNESQLSMLEKLELPYEWHVELQSYAHRKGIEFLSTAFDIESLRFLNTLDMPLYKIPSGELTNGPLLWQFARMGKPLILSTGMALLGEVEESLAVVAHALCSINEPSNFEEVWRCWSNEQNRRRLQGHVTLLHCTSQYPTPPEEVNLCAMDTLAHSFGLPVGYSDHTEGTLFPVAAVARGARVIEKHFTIDRGMSGPDHQASLQPDELREMVRDIRQLERSLGDGRKAPQASEWDTRSAARQQVTVTRDINRGEVLSREDLTTARCGGGRPANGLWDSVGMQVSRGYKAGDSIDI
ncbi:N-acetylneuraminate synthase [Pollutimonas thiosulfatoxidans]|uniref:N-acetylneuraminate synthase n=1 Tax=Pollutimonas thiosulfatoxidans TaxID=2028345 RepID=A0A410GEJ1_9BURK|nr:N-acetylneuraminate synthase [Pollutimonas thiosulfatoxidans]QAA94713.1 N-acetylneuraminate synthase [Pollutimonas thiosulfatoxidans]